MNHDQTRAPDDARRQTPDAGPANPIPLPDPASYDWIFFDCFNTLIADRDDSGEALGLCGVWPLAVVMGLAASVDELNDRYRSWRLMRRQATDTWREADLDERLRGVLGADLDRPGVQGRLREAWRHGFPRQTGPIAGVPAMLAHWKSRKRLAVVSNFYVAGYPQDMLERRSLLPYLAFVVDSAAFGIRKPDPRIYAEALRLAEVSDAQRVLFIGDSWTNDIEGPRRVGMQTAWFDAGRLPRPEGADEVPAIRDWNTFR
jgi:putative hydrolase of the HAD superfamily